MATRLLQVVEGESFNLFTNYWKTLIGVAGENQVHIENSLLAFC